MSDPTDPQEIILVPVDENGRVLLFTDVKIENVDADYRTIRDPNGLTWKIIPGDYTVKIFLRNLQMKTIPLKVEPGVGRYRLPVITEQEASAAESGESPDISYQIQPPTPPPPRQMRPPEVIIPLENQKTVPSRQIRPPEVIVPPEKQKAGSSEKDRRDYKDSGASKRFPISFPVSYRTDSGKWIDAKALNVSGSGICVQNFGKITENDNLYVRLHVPVATVPIECPARVVWVTSKESSLPCMGLQLFLTANMREALDRWLSAM